MAFVVVPGTGYDTPTTSSGQFLVPYPLHSSQRNATLQGSLRCVPLQAVQRPALRRHSTLIQNRMATMGGVPVFRPPEATSMPPPPAAVLKAAGHRHEEATLQASNASDATTQPADNAASKWSHSSQTSAERQSSAQFAAAAAAAAAAGRLESPPPSLRQHPAMFPPGAVMIYEQPQLEPLSLPYWYPMPPPMPVYLPTHPGQGQMGPMFAPPLPRKTSTYRESACEQLCCSGVAQLLWTIITIVLMGILAALVLALFVI